LTRGRWKRFWFLEDGSGRKPGAYVGARQGASEVRYVGLVRGRIHRDADGGPIPGHPAPSPPFTWVESESARRTDRSWVSAVKRTLIRGRIAARWFGAGRCGVGNGLRLVIDISAVAGQCGASRGLGSPAICRGARYEKSVAEVGEKHLPRNPEGSREANRGRREVARRGGSIPDEGSFIVSGELVRSRVQRT